MSVFYRTPQEADRQFAETDEERRERLSAKRKAKAMGHTPGPWRVHPFDGHVSAGERLVANCMGHSDNQNPHCRDENIANARLIAAAPSLLEACEDIARYYGIDPGSNSPLEWAVANKVRDAIRAAKQGEE